MVLVPQDGETMLLDNIAVRPQCQKSGYGRALMSWAEHIAGDAGKKWIILYTIEAMRENLAWYPRLGLCEDFEHRTENGYRRAYFRKALQSRLKRIIKSREEPRGSFPSHTAVHAHRIRRFSLCLLIFLAARGAGSAQNLLQKHGMIGVQELTPSPGWAAAEIAEERKTARHFGRGIRFWMENMQKRMI